MPSISPVMSPPGRSREDVRLWAASQQRIFAGTLTSGSLRSRCQRVWTVMGKGPFFPSPSHSPSGFPGDTVLSSLTFSPGGGGRAEGSGGSGHLWGMAFGDPDPLYLESPGGGGESRSFCLFQPCGDSCGSVVLRLCHLSRICEVNPKRKEALTTVAWEST